MVQHEVDVGLPVIQLRLLSWVVEIVPQHVIDMDLLVIPVVVSSSLQGGHGGTV